MAVRAKQIKDVNIRYHDAAAFEYDAKWGIDYGELGQGQVLGKIEKALGKNPGPFKRGLEIGSGTGYFALNMRKAGLLESVVCSDISEGMLKALRTSANAQKITNVKTVHTEAEKMPFADESFDLIFGHAVLHHLPNLEASFAEFERLLVPGGRLLFCGEPSRYGDKIASVPKRAASIAAPLWRRALSVRAAQNGYEPGDGHAMEPFVDVHAFVPGQLAAYARGAGLVDIKVHGEELLANWFGWANRGLEASGNPDDIPMLWRKYAYHGYLALQKVDKAVLESALPASLFYNLLLVGTKAS